MVNQADAFKLNVPQFPLDSTCKRKLVKLPRHNILSQVAKTNSQARSVSILGLGSIGEIVIASGFSSSSSILPSVVPLSEVVTHASLPESCSSLIKHMQFPGSVSGDVIGS